MLKAAPQPTPETQPFWDAAAQGRLCIQRCVSTGRYFFYPRPYSPYSLGGETEWVTVSGEATLYSYNIIHRPPAPGFEDDTPYAVAVVQLAEGPRMMTNLVSVAATPQALTLDMPLTVRFEDRGTYTLPVFAPTGIGA